MAKNTAQPQKYSGDIAKKNHCSFTIPGKLCPNNLVIRHVQYRAVKSKRAREDQERVRKIAKIAAEYNQWTFPADNESIFLHIICYNPLGDIDGRQKIIMDALGPLYGPKRTILEKGIIYPDDKRVKKLLIEDLYDWSGTRYTVHIEKIPTPQRTQKLRKLRFSDLTQEDIASLFPEKSYFINPKPNIAEPLWSEHVPTSWIIKAKKIKEAS